ncbi:hypothetical protein KY290_012991 [Solanum tuberosum]|uniref:Uncharacterized protein n=1 Tax=Solanum tuberosum TaxID=4113 RepID=A0ABQ7VL56_SOLTU|nr:hypothetical protein KY285_012754 [Solanum tuberosum]KAH0769010.1 hypothetical protein KY290_012991 [Solanum tuberosum]
MCAPDFGETQDAHKVKIEEEPTELEKKRKRKGKGKMVESPNKGDNRIYVTRGTIQKLLADALAANEAQTIRNRRQRQFHSVPTEYPISLPQEIGSNETEFEDIFKAMMKRWRNKELSLREILNLGKNHLQKGPRVTGQTTHKPVEGKVMTREECVSELEKQKVLSGRVFDTDIFTEHGMYTPYDFVPLQSWEHLFECPAPYLHELELREFYYKMELLDDGGIQTTVREVNISLSEACELYWEFPLKGSGSVNGVSLLLILFKRATKDRDIKCAGLPKKFLRGEY